MEVYKQINGYPKYEISNMGNVRSFLINKNGAELKKSINPAGYYRISLTGLNGQKGTYIHRLVAMHFIDNPNNYNIVDHANGIRTDNRVENLRWCNDGESMQNRAKQSKKSSSKYKGVCFFKGKWQVTIGLGMFKTEKEAGMRYNEASSQLFGKFARLNKIEE